MSGIELGLELGRVSSRVALEHLSVVRHHLVRVLLDVTDRDFDLARAQAQRDCDKRSLRGAKGDTGLVSCHWTEPGCDGLVGTPHPAFGRPLPRGERWKTLLAWGSSGNGAMGVERLAAHSGGARCLAFSRYLPRLCHCDRGDRCNGCERKKIFRFPDPRNVPIHETRRILLKCLDRCHRSRRGAPNTSESPRMFRVMLAVSDRPATSVDPPSEGWAGKVGPPFATCERNGRGGLLTGEQCATKIRKVLSCVERGTALAYTASEFSPVGSRRPRPGLVPDSSYFPAFLYFLRMFRPAMAPGWQLQVSETVFGPKSLI
jgi:hypothetical protein